MGVSQPKKKKKKKVIHTQTQGYSQCCQQPVPWDFEAKGRKRSRDNLMKGSKPLLATSNTP